MPRNCRLWRSSRLAHCGVPAPGRPSSIAHSDCSSSRFPRRHVGRSVSWFPLAKPPPCPIPEAIQRPRPASFVAARGDTMGSRLKRLVPTTRTDITISTTSAPDAAIPCPSVRERRPGFPHRPRRPEPRPSHRPTRLSAACSGRCCVAITPPPVTMDCATLISAIYGGITAGERFRPSNKDTAERWAQPKAKPFRSTAYRKVPAQ